jgi:hypothetical protein
MRKFIFLLLLTFPTILFAQQNEVTWDFPVKPGSEEWKAFQSSEEMVNACQIPYNILTFISTEELLNICLRYPLFLDIHFANNLQDGNNYIISSFNGLKTLFERKDCLEVLLNFYLREVPSPPNLKKENNKLKVFYLELLLSQTGIINDFNEKQKKLLLERALYIISDKQKKEYSTYYLHGTALILSRLINSSDIKNELKNDELLTIFNKNGSFIDSARIQDIIEIAKKLY